MERFWSKVAFPEPLPQGEFLPEGCWNWIGARDPQRGYGFFSYGGKLRNAHRVAVHLSGRVIPPGMHVDHLCRNRSCVNPEHLEVVTPRVNAQRKQPSRLLDTQCQAGHEFTEENTLWRRECLTCQRAKMRRIRKEHPMNKRDHARTA